MINPLIDAYQEKSLSHAELLTTGYPTASRLFEELINFLKLDQADFLLFESGQPIKVSDAKRIRQFASLSRSIGPLKLILIPEAELITPEAASALLKTLEEPSPKTTFILATKRLEDILPTIRSRCQIRRILEPEITELSAHPIENLTLVEYFTLSKGIASGDDSLPRCFHGWLTESSQAGANQVSIQSLILSYLSYLPSNPNRRLLLDNFFLKLYTMNHKQTR